jgi:large subunit ribosomal protein L30e
MPGNLELEKQLKLVAKTGTYVVGRREVSTSLKGSKLLVWSASANVPQMILDECRTLSVPAIKFGGNPVELGRACGIPFRVSVIALKSTGDADLSGFSKSADYFSGVAPVPTKQATVETKQETGEKPKKEKKKTESTAEEAPKKTKKSAKESGESDDKKSKGAKSGKSSKTKKKDEATDASKEKKSTSSKKKKKSDDIDSE